MSQTTPPFAATVSSLAIVLFAGSCALACAHAQAGGPAIATAAGNPRAPGQPASEVRTVEVEIGEKGIKAPTIVVAGAVTFSFSNTTTRERTARVEGRGGPWKTDRPIPPNRSMTIEALLEAGEYVLVSGQGQSVLRARFQAIQP